MSLQKKFKFKCQDYIKAVERSLKKTYSDILKINTILTRWQDVDYRNTIKSKKVKEFDIQQTTIIRIKTSMQDFEANFLSKFKFFFEYSTKDYKSDLENKISTLTWRTEEYVKPYISLINQQLLNIDWLIKAKDFKEIFDNSKKYFYIKNKLDEDWNRYFVKW